jgi:excisionase family DNA binding protein
MSMSNTKSLKRKQSPTVLTTLELAERWKTTKWTIERQIKRGELHAIKVGCHYRVHIDEVVRIERAGVRS